MFFRDRVDAGKQLAELLKEYNGAKNVIVLGLPRGGVVVAAEVAKILKLLLDIVVARKIGAPDDEELAIGAITPNGKGVFNERLIAAMEISDDYIHQKVIEEKEEALRRSHLYRGNRPKLNLKNKIVIVVDDGVATGYSLKAALQYVRTFKPKRVIIAVPVIAADTLSDIKKEVDEVFYLDAPWNFGAVGAFYQDFRQVEDEEVEERLKAGKGIRN